MDKKKKKKEVVLKVRDSYNILPEVQFITKPVKEKK
jgi:hypothetical protein